MKLPINRRQIILAGAMASLAPPALAESRPAVESGRSVDLWPGGPPGAERVTVREELIDRLPDGPMRDRVVQHVTRPRITLFEPHSKYKGKPKGITLLIVPGGGYVRVVLDKEGFEVAELLAARGFAAAVLHYRLPADGWTSGADAPVHDAMRALRVLRDRSRAHKTSPTLLGVIGFSAGGHLSARLLTEPDLSYSRRDAVDDLSARPDFGVLMYPVIATTGAFVHAGSVQQLRDAGVADTALARYAPHLNVNAQTPPTLLVHAGDDEGVPVENSLLFYDALRKAHVRSELHVFDRGGHGFGLRNVEGKDVAAWPTLVENWALNQEMGSR
jgi:acetyl esterase/lipase